MDRALLLSQKAIRQMSINNTLCKNQIDENWNNMKCYKNEPPQHFLSNKLKYGYEIY